MNALAVLDHFVCGNAACGLYQLFQLVQGGTGVVFIVRADGNENDPLLQFFHIK